MTKLDQLNEFLESKSLDLPKNRRVVDKHGCNLLWLRKHLCTRNVVPDHIKDLIQKDISSLVKETC